MTGAMQAVEAADEGLHPPVNDPLWSESYYFNFSDSQGTSGGFARVALYPQRDQAEGLLCLYLPRGIGIIVVKHPVAQLQPGIVRSGALGCECVEPLRQWRLTYDGDLHLFEDASQVPGTLAEGAPLPASQRARVDLLFTGLHPPFFYPRYQRVAGGPPFHGDGRAGLGRSLRRAWRLPREAMLALRMRSGRHYEQSMQVRGSITVGDTQMPLDGTGHRDHSWGLRDFGIMPRMRWLSGQMDGFAFNAVYITIAGSHVTNGYVCEEGRCTPVDTVVLRNTFDDGGLAGRAIHLELTAGGRTHVITGDVVTNVPLPIAGKDFSTIYTVGRTRYRCGDRAGYGVAEFLERLDP